MANDYQQTPDFAQHLPERLLRLPAVKAGAGISKASIYKMVKEGTFPAPLKIGRASAWRSSEVAAWIASRSAPARSSQA